jgi:hypothetical protein
MPGLLPGSVVWRVQLPGGCDGDRAASLVAGHPLVLLGTAAAAAAAACFACSCCQEWTAGASEPRQPCALRAQSTTPSFFAPPSLQGVGDRLQSLLKGRKAGADHIQVEGLTPAMLDAAAKRMEGFSGREIAKFMASVQARAEGGDGPLPCRAWPRHAVEQVALSRHGGLGWGGVGVGCVCGGGALSSPARSVGNVSSSSRLFLVPGVEWRRPRR